jgi:hypothetical protein
LAWGPQTSLKDGLTRTISYFERLLAEPAMRSQIEAIPQN